MKIPELLAPAGNMEKAKVAIAYGADAIYLSGELYGMRAQAGNFTNDEIEEAVRYAHERGVKVYVTVNIIPHNQHLDGLPEYIAFLKSIGVDAIIVSDVGVISIARRSAPELPLHLSTQANTVNREAACFWSDFGIARIVLAREVTREEIEEIRSNVTCELELFVHGAMCMAYSGRCLLSAVMTGRDANLGACTQGCRWKYSVMETKRPGEYFPIEESKEGLISSIPKICACWSIFRGDRHQCGQPQDRRADEKRLLCGDCCQGLPQGFDDYAANPEGYRLDPELLAEVNKVSHRPYYPGFFFGERIGIYTTSSAYIQTHDFVGTVESYDHQAGEALIGVRNFFPSGSSGDHPTPRRSG